MASIILRSDAVDGVITKDHTTFLGADEIKHRVKNIIKQTNIIDMSKIMERLNVDSTFHDEIIRICKLKKKLENQHERETETIAPKSEDIDENKK